MVSELSKLFQPKKRVIVIVINRQITSASLACYHLVGVCFFFLKMFFHVIYSPQSNENNYLYEQSLSHGVMFLRFFINSMVDFSSIIS